jgi:photosystem II stability/assembly factor-like uncharacterized protein
MAVKCWMRVGFISVAAMVGAIGCSSAPPPVESLLSAHRHNRAAAGAACGWSFQNPRPQGNSLLAVTAPAPGSLVAVGEYGAIVRSDDGGETWTQQCSGTTYHLQDVFFVDAQTGWAVGGYEDWSRPGSRVYKQTILHTTDGGISWAPQVSGAGYPLFGVSFVNPNAGFAVSIQSMLYTTDGGRSWRQRSDVSGSSIFFLDAKTGWIVGPAPGIFHTTDGGATWTRQSAPQVPLRRVSFVDANVGIAVGGNYFIVPPGIWQESQAIVRTTDGGATWTLLRSGSDRQLRAISPVDANNWIAVGRIGTILQTMDGGDTWMVRNGRTPESLYGMLLDGSSATVVGDNGTILITGDGGETWNLQSSGTTHHILGVAFVDAKNGWAVGQLGTILRTEDSGGTWTLQSSSTNTSLNGVSFADANTGTAVGNFGTILRTTDGGESWVPQSSGTTWPLFGVSFVDANTGWAVGGYSPQGVILHTRNGGATWTTQSTGTNSVLYGVSFVDANMGWAVGARPDNELILHTTDGGATWTTQSGGTNRTIYGVSFVDANTGTVVGADGTILRTVNGGATWTRQTSGTGAALYGVSLADADTGWAAGAVLQCISRYSCRWEGLILNTIDGGRSWARQYGPTAKVFRAVSFVDTHSGTAVGDYGTILRTDTGGQ